MIKAGAFIGGEYGSEGPFLVTDNASEGLSGYGCLGVGKER